MSNKEYKTDELALRVQAGETELLGDLWLSVQAFIRLKAIEYLHGWSDSADYDKLDDMVNESYFGMVRAVEKYDPTKGAFLTLLTYYLPNAFKTALIGGVTSKYENALDLNAESIYKPVSDVEDIYLIDVIADESAAQYMEQYENDEYAHDVHNFLMKCIRELTDELMQDIIIYMYFNESNFKQAVNMLAPDLCYWQVRGRLEKSMRELRRIMYKSSKLLEADKIGLSYDNYRTSYIRFRRASNQSDVERIALKHVERIERVNAIKNTLKI